MTIHHEHRNTYMEWKFKSLRIWPSEKSIVREFRLRHFLKFFSDNNRKSFWDSYQTFTFNCQVHRKVNLFCYENIETWYYRLEFPASTLNVSVETVAVLCANENLDLNTVSLNGGVKYLSITRNESNNANWDRFQCQKRCELWQHCKKKQQFSEIPIAYQNLCFAIFRL